MSTALAVVVLVGGFCAWLGYFCARLRNSSPGRHRPERREWLTGELRRPDGSHTIGKSRAKLLRYNVIREPSERGLSR